ncbi:hypothetical protein REPUB_Repub20aG0051400 [Reevesia pubescens]
MKPQMSATSSSVKSTTTTMEDIDIRSDTRDSCYYPGCRKDANCNCEICLASINATLDLIPVSVQKSSFTKLSASRPNVVNQTPISFDPSILSTPKSSSCSLVESPALKSTARLNLREKKEKKEGKKGNFEGVFWKFLLGLSLVFGMEIGFSWILDGALRPALTRDIVRSIGQRALIVQDLNGKLRFLENELKVFANGKVSNCSNADSIWEIDQECALRTSLLVALKQLSSTCKYEGTLGFSESEIDVARQLIKLCSDNNDNDNINIGDKMGLTGKRRRIQEDEFDAASAMIIEDIFEDNEDENFKPRKTKSRSIHYIYRSTKPLVVFDAKKICCS